MTITTVHNADDIEALQALQGEHRLVLRVLAVAVDQLLAATDAEQLIFSAEAMRTAPALSAWRERTSGNLVLTVAPSSTVAP